MSISKPSALDRFAILTLVVLCHLSGIAIGALAIPFMGNKPKVAIELMTQSSPKEVQLVLPDGTVQRYLKED